MSMVLILCGRKTTNNIQTNLCWKNDSVTGVHCAIFFVVLR